MTGGVSVEAWLERSLAGEEAAWMHLLGGLWDQVDRQVRTSRFMGHLRSSVDDRREVVSRVFARLRRHDFRALRTFPAWRERNPDKTFDYWLTIVVANVTRDYVAERVGDLDVDGHALKRLINTLAESLDHAEAAGARPAITNTIAATEILALARTRLPAEQWAALYAWLAGAEFAEIADARGLASEHAARHQVRAALARLRRELRPEAA
jgi:hypothetical protein